jgi:phospholipid transport system substrate-binding protein
MSLRRRSLLGVMVALAVPGLAGPAVAADPSAAAPIMALNQALVASMKAGKSASFAQRYAGVVAAVDKAFDLPAVLQQSVGPRFASLPADQQAKLLDVFRKFTATSYAANFDGDEGEKLVVLPEQRAVGDDLVVQTQIVPAKGDAVRIDYVMHKGPQGWRAIDVLLNGNISQNAVKRSDFRSLVTPTSAQGLIDSLQKKVVDLSGGALS